MLSEGSRRCLILSEQRNFWKLVKMEEMKSIKGSKKTSCNLPDNVAGVSGEQLIVEEFRSVYCALYNSYDTSEKMAELKSQLNDQIGPDSVLVADLITGQVVKEAARRMKPDKADVSGSFSSNAILNAPDSFFDLIAPVYRSWLVHGTVTLSLLACAFLPLFKGGLKDPSKTDSYRAIAGASLLLQLFDYVVLLLWGDRLGTDSLQFGFKAGTSTTQCSWLVMEVANHFLRNGTPCVVTLLDCTKAFDKCSFFSLFKKLSDKNLPPVVIRVLIFVYQEQTAWVKWGHARSNCFGVLNGTRQGSVLSPIFFAVYIDDLLKELRQLGVGCHIGGVFLGAAGFADDLILVAPCRSAMAQMLDKCETYAEKNNLTFSTDPNPSKSKTKCMYICGKVKKPDYPAPLQLYGVDLPWVEHATHLGHELHQDGTMELDAKMKRAQFIENSTEIREMFSFGHPSQVLRAVQMYSCHFYGSMLWDLFGDMAGQVYRSWNTCVKLSWGIPRSSHNYFVDHLAAPLHSVKKKLLCQYVSFYQRLSKSTSREVRIMSSIVAQDIGSVTGRNLRNIAFLFKSNPKRDHAQHFKQVDIGYQTPEIDKWRVPLLRKLLDQRSELYSCEEDTSTIDELIESLCAS